MSHMVANGLTEARAEQPDGPQIKETYNRDITIWPHEGGEGGKRVIGKIDSNIHLLPLR